jgi:chromosome segregation ATPase
MSKSNKDLNESVTKLEESLKEKDAVISEQKERIARLVKSRKDSVSEAASLNESIESKSTEVKTLTESLDKANEEVKALNEKLSANKQDSDRQISELREGLSKAESIKEAYKKLANKAVNKYIENKANMLGLTSADIKRKLGESYTLEDVDQVCEDLKTYQLNVSKLPFSIDRKVGVKVNEAAPRIISKKTTESFDDDEVDESLIRLANLD